MVVCIPLVFRVIAVRRWWVYLGVLGGSVVVGWPFGSVVVAYSVVDGETGCGSLLGVGSNGFGLV